MVEYDVIVVGAGMSGATMARKLTQQKKKVLVLERNESFGGVWHTTNWSWLTSDTLALMYTLHNPVGDKFAREQPYRPLSRANILEMIKYETIGLQINYNERVIRADYTRRWCVTTNNATYYAKWIVNASGVYSKPFMPLKGDNVIHSSEFTDATLQGKQNVAVIGARESGIQLAVNLPNVTWFSRSFNNAYFPVYSRDSHILTNRRIYNRVLELFVEGMFQLTNAYKQYNIQIPFGYSVIPNHAYDYKQPIRPVFSTIFKCDVKPNILTHNTDFTDFDLVISATGHKCEPTFQTYVDGKLITEDVFYLRKYCEPKRLPNFYYCIPIATSTTEMLEQVSNYICEQIRTNQKPSRHKYYEWTLFVDEFLRKRNSSKEELMYNSRNNTFVYLPSVFGSL